MSVETDKFDCATDKIPSWLSGKIEYLSNFVLPRNIFYYSKQDTQKIISDQLNTGELTGFHFLPKSSSPGKLPGEVIIIISKKKI